MSKEQHMRTPWILGGSAAWSEAAKDRGPIFICDIREGTHIPVGTNQANARFIVRAVNEYDANKEALRGVAIMLNTELAKYENEPWAQRVRACLAEKES